MCEVLWFIQQSGEEQEDVVVEDEVGGDIDVKPQVKEETMDTSSTAGQFVYFEVAPFRIYPGVLYLE